MVASLATSWIIPVSHVRFLPVPLRDSRIQVKQNYPTQTLARSSGMNWIKASTIVDRHKNIENTPACVLRPLTNLSLEGIFWHRHWMKLRWGKVLLDLRLQSSGKGSGQWRAIFFIKRMLQTPNATNNKVAGILAMFVRHQTYLYTLSSGYIYLRIIIIYMQ